MASNKDAIVIEIQLDDGSIKKAFVNIEKTAEESGQKVGKSLQSGFGGAKLAAGLAGAFAVFKGLTKAVDLLGDSIAAASQEVDAINRLNSSLAMTGKFTQETSQSIQDFANQLQATTRFGNETTLEVASLIQTLGRLDQEGLTRATKAALDLSSALGIDVNTASTLVGKAANGNVQAFSRLGIQIQKGKTDAETFANALKVLETRFGGASERSAQTFSGSLQQLKNNFGDTLEEIGKVITQSPALVAVFNTINGILVKVATTIREQIGGRDILRPIIIEVINFSAALTSFLGPAFELTVRLANLFFESIKTGFLAIATGLSFVGSLVEKALNKIFGTDLSSATNNLKTNFEALSASAKSTDEALSSAFSTEKTTQALDFMAQLSGAVQNTNGKLTELTATTSALPSVVEPALRGFVFEFQGLQNVALDVSQNIRQGFANAASQGIQGFVKALKNGQNALSAFGQAMLGVFGDLAIQIGTTLLAAGIGLTALFELSGPKAIVAGIALIGIGSVLKAIAGGGSSPASVGGSLSDQGGTTTAPIGAPIPETEQRGPTNQVSLIVQGDILDSDGTASRITQLLQDYTDKNGQTVFV